MTAKWDLSRTSFLLVEDNPHMRSILRSVLSGFGVRQIHEASDGAEGLDAVVERTPDVVLIDWHMTPLDGGDFVRMLRGDPDLTVATTPVLVISARPKKTTIVQAVQLGIHGFVAKPVAPAVLYDRVSNVLYRQSLYGRTRGLLKTQRTPPKTKVKVTDLTQWPDPNDKQDLIERSLALL
ncbi:hypothetical protein GCM10011316_13100 [Roseibium aquae]|uniref:Response regulatory domain-containing protein n=1 Tax=Roseibium aquae TaxID=1323746 RepID=A0A916WYM0_9HYPH|nr:response regulator [Roseibium aquae]GGB42583.1 hypothetical protein GCM10011316_13100 [Roseibium aquae]